VEQLTNQLIDSLKQNRDPKDSQVEYDALIQAMTKKAFKKIKGIEEQIARLTDETEIERLKLEKNQTKKNLQESVIEISAIADKYLLGEE